LNPVAKELGYGPGSFPMTECQAERILAIPIHQYLSEQDIDHVANSINNFFQ
jgi:dTDP-4-amino-4,6-dideoxygalactose transaminase